MCGFDQQTAVGSSGWPDCVDDNIVISDNVRDTHEDVTLLDPQIRMRRERRRVWVPCDSGDLMSSRQRLIQDGSGHPTSGAIQGDLYGSSVKT